VKLRVPNRESLAIKGTSSFFYTKPVREIEFPGNLDHRPSVAGYSEFRLKMFLFSTSFVDVVGRVFQAEFDRA